MNGKLPLCPRCKSIEVDYVVRRDEYLCASCNNLFKNKTKAESLRIFLSYGHDDKAFIACEIKKELEKLGNEVWYDLDKLKCGANWEEYIQDGLEWLAEDRSKARFILLMTPHSVRRPNGFCLNEMTRAIEKEIPIFPVMLEMCEPPLSICRIQYLDMREGYREGEVKPKFHEKIRELTQALIYKKSDFEGTLTKLRTILDPIPFEASAIKHKRRFIGREWVKEKIDLWLNDEKSDKILWITGVPGAGKSALASDLLFEKPYTKAFFLCKAPGAFSRGVYEPGDPRWCVRTIAYHLSTLLPDYRDRLNQLNLEHIIKENSAESLFERLIVESLKGIHFPHEQNVVALIDGLDEVTYDGCNELASFIVKHLPNTPKWLKFIITSRYEEPLIYDMQRYKPCKIEDERELNEKDHRQFIKKEFKQFANNKNLYARTVEMLMNKSECNFLFLELVREGLEKGELLLKDINESFPRGLGEFYKFSFRRRFKDIQKYRNYYDTFAIILAISTPVSWEEAESLFGWNKAYDIQNFKSYVGALFKYDNDQIIPYHQSLIEWLTNQQKAGDYWIRLKDGHKLLAQKGYDTYKSKTVLLATPGELKCVQELPIHLLFIKEFDKVAEFLTDPEAFVTYYSENILGYIKYWNSLCCNDTKKRWALPDCLRLMLKKLDNCKIIEKENTDAWEACFSIGRLFFELKEFEQSALMFQKSLLLFPKNHDDATLARIYNDLGESFSQMGKIDDAECNYRFALDLRKKIHNVHPDLAESINNLGHADFNRGMYEKAMKQYRKALEMWRKIPDGPHYGEADSLHNIAYSLKEMGNNDEAAITYKQCTDVLDNLKYFNWGISVCRNNYGNFLKLHGKTGEALHQYRLSYELLLDTYGPEHESTIQSANKIAILHLNTKQPKQALNLFKEINESCRKLFGPYHPKTMHALNLLGEGMMLAGKLKEAKELFIDVVNRIGKSEIQDKQVDAQSLHNMGAICFYLIDYNKALKYLLKAIKLREKIYPAGHEYILRTYEYALQAYVNKKDHVKTTELAEKCYSTHVSQLDYDSRLYYEKLIFLGRILRVSGKWKSAEKCYRAIIEKGEMLLESINEKPYSIDSRISNLAYAYNEIAFHFYVPEQNWIEAERYYRRGVELIKTQDNEVESANLKLNLYTVLHKSSKNIDEDEIRTLVNILENAKDSRAKKGYEILKD